MKVLILGGWAPSLLRFRGSLIAALIGSGHEVVAAAADADPWVRSGLDELGAELHEIQLTRTGINAIEDLRSFAELVTLFREVKPDLLLAYTAKPVIYGCPAAKLAGVPRIYALITGLGYAFLGQERLSRRLLSKLVQQMYRASLATSDGVLFQNPDDRAQFRELGLIPRDKPTAVTNGSGVDLGHYQLVPPVSEPMSFLMVARLLRDKGVLEYVDAARLLKERHPEARIQLLGPLDPHPDAISQEQVDSWVANGVIEYLGAVDDVRPYIASASVVVLPSYREGTPRSVLEAMSMGRPIVTTDVPGCRETVVEGENGFLVPARDATSLQRAMERFVSEPGLIPAMGARSRELAETKYDVHSVNQTIFAGLGLEPAAPRGT